MLPLILFHLGFFAALFGLAMPGLSELSGGTVDFGGGIIAIAVMAVLSEVAVFIAAIISNALMRAVGVNPLLQRKKGELISAAMMTIYLAGFYLSVHAVFPAVITVTVLSALLTAAIVTVVFFAALHIKRKIIASMP